ncbi:hypothetical protein A2U01_0047117 [Trifolium medium]|uniref:Uncharacterized protein n=1 Tax=Trifolium medium TaxID=97028 RepID=A0A392QQX4_9FABA|nr:hypothetical protein [Trifolium medium]
MGIPEPHGETRTPLGMGLRFYLSYPLRIETNLGKPELYGFGFGKGKIRPSPAPLPCLRSAQLASA